MGDGDIDHAAVELLGGSRTGQWRQAQGCPGSVISKGRGKAPDQGYLGVFGHAGGEDAGALCRIEADAEVECGLDMLDRGGDQRCDLAGAGGRLHAGRGTDEQIIGEQVAQPRQRVAHRRLRKADPVAGAGHGALGGQRVKGFEEVEVDRPDIHAANG